MAQRKSWVRGVVLGSALLLAPVGAWADKLTELEQAFETQQKSLQQLQQEMNRLRQDRTAQQTEIDRRVMEVEKKAAEAAASSLLTGYEPGKGFFLKSADDQFRLNLGGYIQTWMQVEGSRREAEYDGFVAAGKARHTPSTFKQRRTRIILSGQLYKDFNFHIEPELSFGATGPNNSAGAATDNSNGGGARLEAGWASYTYAPWAKVKVGQFRDMFSLEMITASQDLDFAERSVATRALAPDLQLGLQLSGNVKLANVLPVFYSAGVFNGCGRIDQCKGGIDNDGDKEVLGRFAFAPPMPFGNLTIGLNADYRTFRIVKNSGATDVNGVTTPVVGTSFHRFNPVGPTGVALAGNGVGGTQNGFLINGNRVTGGGDFAFDFYPFLVKGEYLYATQERDALGAGGSNLDNLIMQGGYGTVGYWIFGNKRSGLLAIGRYEHFRVDDRSGAFNAAAGTSEKPMEMRSGTAGLNWYVNPSVRVRANYIATSLSPRENMTGLSNATSDSKVAHQGIAELQLLF
ncbi:porin [Candidatus Methylomirabilis sp.]|uniref:porin n=1 Tax=Candidatus Methylomirabilis sp. TaxID=2032687 RepID=UPI002A5F000C|nr:porin [Candidatus Methylomirabilis sp.]